jgi:ABC-type branched-subunit amino acid transport system ATPase component
MSLNEVPNVPVQSFLEVRDLRRDFGGVWAVDGASFEAQSGCITALIGPNGAGKSTVVDLIGGALRPTSGQVLMDGRDITALKPHERARLGLVRTYQMSSEFGRLTVLENLLVGVPDQRGERFRTLVIGKRYWREQEEAVLVKAFGLMDRFAMSEKRDEYAGNLSGGQKRLLEIMRSLMAEPKLLLLDEPMAGINPTLARVIEGYLSDLAKEGLTMLLIEHELDVVDRLCESVVFMAQGKVIATGKMEELLKNTGVLNAYLAG